MNLAFIGNFRSECSLCLTRKRIYPFQRQTAGTLSQRKNSVDLKRSFHISHLQASHFHSHITSQRHNNIKRCVSSTSSLHLFTRTENNRPPPPQAYQHLSSPVYRVLSNSAINTMLMANKCDAPVRCAELVCQSDNDCVAENQHEACDAANMRHPQVYQQHHHHLQEQQKKHQQNQSHMTPPLPPR